MDAALSGLDAKRPRTIRARVRRASVFIRVKYRSRMDDGGFVGKEVQAGAQRRQTRRHSPRSAPALKYIAPATSAMAAL
jgi:hypothetical protein